MAITATLSRSQRSIETDLATLEAMISELASNMVPAFTPEWKKRRRCGRRGFESTSSSMSTSEDGSYSYSYGESGSGSEHGSQESVEEGCSEEDMCEMMQGVGVLGTGRGRGRGDGVGV
ncbi:hypothetical protein BO78DRAFT_398063 [Aspergillus sclerotiicarbonarius CBS 121057]|uniref:Uncharacterized protein n=1 Tax=Aspergillus sclerotiicarbonarius (strain CBS 121057 / IBT 28362) TaxID=1448318 RepID=A0A319EP51_ASPSB|nr:hypothetical protein BO78DRAFT_398063 [Aspergillus sclerotiicarbonarius CBS 121057]